MTAEPSTPQPLAGVTVVDYSQFVAGPLCTLLLAHLGADVIKVESPRGDAYRHYEPFGDGTSTRFFALNQGKRSVVCDLKTEEGRRRSQALLRSADVVVHNMPPAKAARFGLDKTSIHEVNPEAVVASVNALGTDGPHRDQVGYDLIAQAYAGLIMADVDPGDDVPRRSGNVPFSDITAGLLACISVLSGLAARPTSVGAHYEVSLLGAALLTQIQDVVRFEDFEAPGPDAPARAGVADLREVAQTVRDRERLDPYYRCYAAADGFIAVACLTTAQRRRVLEVLGLDDPFVANPQSPPASERERIDRENHTAAIEKVLAGQTAQHWIDAFAACSVPAGDVRLLQQAFDDEQVRANGLVRTIAQGPNGRLDLYGSPFKIDGVPAFAARRAPMLDEHGVEFDETPTMTTTQKENR